MTPREKYLRAELEEIKIQLIDQGCKTIGDAIRRDEEAFVKMVDICLELGYEFSSDVLAVACEKQQQLQLSQPFLRYDSD